MEGGKEVLGSIADYEAMIDKTTFVPDTNEGKVAEKSETCLVGMNELSCDVASFEVNVANKAATLSVAHNEELRRDISGEIVAVDGTLLYRAELIEMQRGPVAPSSEAGSVARNDWDPFLD
jgi:hypothetical protein